MTPKQIADHLVERGIGQTQYAGTVDNYIPPDSGDELTPDEFIQDWRVAGKVLEQPDAFGLIMNAAGKLAENIKCGLLGRYGASFVTPKPSAQRISRRLKMKDNRTFIGLRDPKEPLTSLSDNVLMARLAHAYRGCRDETKIGDSIDRGLVLLRELNEQGFDVIIKVPNDD